MFTSLDGRFEFLEHGLKMFSQFSNKNLVNYKRVSLLHNPISLTGYGLNLSVYQIRRFSKLEPNQTEKIPDQKEENNNNNNNFI